MLTISYGEAVVTYDISASCINCGFKHIAQFPQGTPVNKQAGCPSCGVAKTLIFGSTQVAQIWKQENSASTCLSCAHHVAVGTIYCNACWNKFYTEALQHPVKHPLESPPAP